MSLVTLRPLPPEVPVLPPRRPESGEVVVRVRCGVCRRVLAEAWGTPSGGVRTLSGAELAGINGKVYGPRQHTRMNIHAGPAGMPVNGPGRLSWEDLGAIRDPMRTVREFWCHRERCGRHYRVRTDALDAAFRVAAAKSRKGDRKIMLPLDLNDY